LSLRLHWSGSCPGGHAGVDLPSFSGPHGPPFRERRADVCTRSWCGNDL